MATTIFNPTISGSYNQSISQPFFFPKFIRWATAQSHNRLLWIGVILAAHGCIITPITAMVVLIAGGSFSLLMLCMVAMAMALVTNLAALPTKITIPVFALSVVIDLVVIVAALFSI